MYVKKHSTHVIILLTKDPTVFQLCQVASFDQKVVQSLCGKHDGICHSSDAFLRAHNRVLPTNLALSLEACDVPCDPWCPSPRYERVGSTGWKATRRVQVSPRVNEILHFKQFSESAGASERLNFGATSADFAPENITPGLFWRKCDYRITWLAHSA